MWFRMDFIFFVVSFACGVCLAFGKFESASAAASDNIVAGVVEYSPLYNKNITSEQNVQANLENYLNIVKKLKAQYVDLRLLVFPEAGLHSVLGIVSNASEIYAEAVPDPEKYQAPSDDSKVLKKLSDCAKSAGIFLVVNFVEKANQNKSDVLFNTNVVFHSNGTVIARYRKIHIFGKEGQPFSTPENKTLSTFYVDKILFGTFTCFDIIFKNPPLTLVAQSVSHFVFPTAWFSELPFLTAIQEQTAWAYGTDTILLAAGNNDPDFGCSGSGVYYGKQFSPISVQAQTKSSFAILSAIPKNLTTQSSTPWSALVYLNDTPTENTTLAILSESLSSFTTNQLTENTTYFTKQESPLSNLTIFSTTLLNETVCSDKFCCHFQGNVTTAYVLELIYNSQFYNGKEGTYGDEFGMNGYSLAVFDGVRGYDDVATGGVQVCSLVSCAGSASGTCANRTDVDSPATVQYGKYTYVRSHTLISNLTITGNFNLTDAFLTSYILVRDNEQELIPGTIKRFGTNADPDAYSVKTVGNSSQLVLVRPLEDVASVNLYARLFDRDGQKVTGSTANLVHSLSLLTLLLFAILQSAYLNHP